MPLVNVGWWSMTSPKNSPVLVTTFFLVLILLVLLIYGQIVGKTIFYLFIYSIKNVFQKCFNISVNLQINNLILLFFLYIVLTVYLLLKDAWVRGILGNSDDDDDMQAGLTHNGKRIEIQNDKSRFLAGSEVFLQKNK